MVKIIFRGSIFGLILFSAADTWAIAAHEERLSIPSDLGVCAHVTRHSFQLRNKAFGLMREAGIGYVRCDHEWKTSQKMKDGPFDWRILDTVVTDAAKYGIKILPILCSPPSWAKPVQDHVEEWRAFVRGTARHFKGRVFAYEIWNEENHPGFWPNPKPADYASALKAAYEEIKDVDPNVRVVIGGTAGCDFDYLEGVYKAGGKPYFDIMNCHPYTWPYPPTDWLPGTFGQLRALMARYGDADKPIWVTEIGWPTHKTNIPTPDIFRTGLKLSRPGQIDWRIGCVGSTDDLGTLDRFVSGIRELVSPGSTVKAYTADDLNAALSCDELDVVVYPFDESYPLKTIDAVIAFVRRGGILVDFGGTPMHFPRVNGKLVEKAADGSSNSERAATAFRLDVYNPTAENGLKKNHKFFASDVARKAGLKFDAEGVRVSRFFSSAKLKDGDEMIPLLTAKDKSGNDVVGGCVIRYGGGMKGALVAVGSTDYRMGSTEIQQAEHCLSMISVAEKCGVEKVFFYEFTAPERDPFYSEDHYGLMHKDLTPKPAYARLVERARRMQSQNVR